MGQSKQWHKRWHWSRFSCILDEWRGDPTQHTERQTVREIDKLISASHTFSLIMATRSRIGIQLKDNSVLSVYHHWDGYPSWLGRILTTHYNSRELASELD